MNHLLPNIQYSGIDSKPSIEDIRLQEVLVLQIALRKEWK
jgi:hypothetical protein